MLVTSIFSFSHNVFKILFFPVVMKWTLCCKGLNNHHGVEITLAWKIFLWCHRPPNLVVEWWVDIIGNQHCVTG